MPALGKSCFKAPKVSLDEYSNLKIFLFANFVRYVNFERSEFEKVGVELNEVYLFALPQLRVLRKSCFKATKNPLDEYFYH